MESSQKAHLAGCRKSSVSLLQFTSRFAAKSEGCHTLVAFEATATEILVAFEALGEASARVTPAELRPSTSSSKLEPRARRPRKGICNWRKDKCNWRAGPVLIAATVLALKIRLALSRGEQPSLT